MIRYGILVSAGLATLAIAAAAHAQATPSEVHARSAAQVQSEVSGLYSESLTPQKVMFRSFLVELRDSLTQIGAVTAQMQRAQSAGSKSVVISGGRWLQKYCDHGSVAADLTLKRVATMQTRNPTGDRQLLAFRTALGSLIEQLRQCQRADSSIMSVRAPDTARVIAIGVEANSAIAQFDLVRDGFLKLLGMRMPLSNAR